MSKTQRYFYAISHRYGASMTATNGVSIGEVWRFDRLKERNEWVANSPTEYYTENGYREALTFNDPAVKEMIEKAELGLADWGNDIY